MLKVQIPRDEPFQFPHQCAWCGHDDPDATYTLRSGTAFSDLFVIWNKWRNSFSCQVPACDKCRVSWMWRRRSHWMIMAGSVLTLIIVARIVYPMIPLDWLPQSEDGINAIVFLGCFLFALPLSALVIQMLPLPVILHSYPEWFDFEFEDEELGREFDQLNNFEEDDEAAEWEDDEELLEENPA